MQQETGRVFEATGPDGERVILKEFSIDTPAEPVWMVDENGDNKQAGVAMGLTTWWASDPATADTDIAIPEGFVITDPPASIFG